MCPHLRIKRWPFEHDMELIKEGVFVVVSFRGFTEIIIRCPSLVNCFALMHFFFFFFFI